MKIKKIFYITSSLFLFLCFAACKKSFLEKSPISSLTTTNFYKTASDAESGLAGAYSFGMSEYYIWDFEINGDVQSDNCYAGGNSGDVQAIDNFNLTPTNGNVTRDWAYIYRCIAGSNAVLDNVPGIADPGLTPARKSQILSEAKFLRALHYFHLATIYGGVPLALSVNGELYPQRETVENVYKQIEKDLNEAENDLPLTADAGKATKGAAQALLAKVYAQQLKYDDCIAACNRVLPSLYGGTGPAGYGLVPDYEHLWDNQHKNSVESIFEIQHSSSTSGFGNWGINLYLPYSITGDTWAKFCSPSNDLINLFNTEGDSIRKKSSVYFENTVASNTTPPPYTSATQPVPFSYKWRIDNGGNWNGDCNTILIRLADIILLKAEALNNKGQTATAIPLVNAIRARVNLLPIDVSDQASVAAAILKERRLELAFEGQRWLDLLRSGTQNTIAVMNSLKDPAGNNLTYGLSVNKLLFPIPQTERDLDKNLSQNPGY
jgi:hypothetical protein